MKNSAPVHVDRLARALRDAGVELKRSKVIEIAAAALGYHNSNEFQAAARRGDLTPPVADIVGDTFLADGTNLMVLRVPNGVPYAIARSTLGADRDSRIGISPYGGMVILPASDGNIPVPAAPASSPNGSLHVAIVERDLDPVVGVGHIELVTGHHRQGCDRALAAFCRDRWDQAHDRPGFVTGHLPLHYDGLDDAQVIETYFESTTDVLLDRRTVSLEDGSSQSGKNAGSQPIATSRGMVMIDADALGTLVEASDAHADTLKEDLDDDGLSTEHRESSSAFIDQIEEALKLARQAQASPMAEPVSTPLAEGSDFRVIHKDVLDEIISAAESHSEDATTGVEDGIYYPEENQWVEALDEALAAANLAREPRDGNAAKTLDDGEMLYAILRTRNGDEVVLGASEAALDRRIADHCRTEWKSIAKCSMGDLNPALLPDDQVIEIFYGAHQEDENSEYSFSRGTSPISSQEADKLHGTTITWGEALFFPKLDPMALAETLRASAQADIWVDGAELGNSDAVVDVAEAKMAMNSAADVLTEMVSSRRSTYPAPTTRRETARSDQPVFTTDVEGNVIYDITREELEAMGLSYGRGDDDREWLPLTDDEFSCLQPGRHSMSAPWDRTYVEIPGLDGAISIKLGQSCVWKDEKWIVPSVEFAFGDGERDESFQQAEEYARNITPLLDAIGGQAKLHTDATDHAHSVDVFIPMSLALQFDGSENLYQALRWLTCPFDLRDGLVRVMASFNTPTSSPGYAVRWDATFDVLLEGRAWAVAYARGDRSEPQTMNLAESRLAHKDAWALWNENWDLEVDMDALMRLYSIR